MKGGLMDQRANKSPGWITMKNLKNITTLIYLPFTVSLILLGGCSKKMLKTDAVKNNVSKDAAVKDRDTGKDKSVPDSVLKFTGSYSLVLPGFKGMLTLKYDRALGKYYGKIFFIGLSKSIPQPLKKLSIKDDKIYFERSVESAEELRKYGGSRYYRQKYYGKFSDDGSEIKGDFYDSGAVSNWRARR
jgi:hypothetical protein